MTSGSNFTVSYFDLNQIERSDPRKPDHDPTCAMARLIASRVMPSFSCFAINAR
jgi:hypothetical protein